MRENVVMTSANTRPSARTDFQGGIKKTLPGRGYRSPGHSLRFYWRKLTCSPRGSLWSCSSKNLFFFLVWLMSKELLKIYLNWRLCFSLGHYSQISQRFGRCIYVKTSAASSLKHCVILRFHLFVFFQCCNSMKYSCYQDSGLMVCLYMCGWVKLPVNAKKTCPTLCAEDGRQERKWTTEELGWKSYNKIVNSQEGLRDRLCRRRRKGRVKPKWTGTDHQ